MTEAQFGGLAQEALYSASPPAQFGGLAQEALYSQPSPPAQFGGLAQEALYSANPPAQFGGLALEVLMLPAFASPAPGLMAFSGSQAENSIAAAPAAGSAILSGSYVDADGTFFGRYVIE